MLFYWNYFYLLLCSVLISDFALGKISDNESCSAPPSGSEESKCSKSVKVDQKLLRRSPALKKGIQLFVEDDIAKLLKNASRIDIDINEKPKSAVFEDLYGFQINWTDPENGWSAAKRKIYLKEHQRNMKQPFVVPQFTKSGFKKMKMPEKLFKYLLENRQENEQYEEECPVLINCEKVVRFSALEVTKKGSSLKNYTAHYIKRKHTLTRWKDRRSVHERIDSYMKPILEEWLGGKIPLIISNFYGIRRYPDGATLGMHVDKLQTHVISAILQIDQDVREDWPLIVVGFDSRHHKIFLKPGEMVLYESAKVPHGRPHPLKGKYFDNIFVHYKPAVKWYEDDFQLATTTMAQLGKTLTLEDLRA